MERASGQILTIFGASGDLTKRKLLPAIYELFNQMALPENFAILGIGRTELTDKEFRDQMENGILEYSENKMERVDKYFLDKLFYLSINTSDHNDYEKIKVCLASLDDKFNASGNFIYYLATPPSLYGLIPEYLGAVGLNKNENRGGFQPRLIIEKPFGYDYESAIELNERLLRYFKEDQIYRIDHYLGKETVQNVLVTRFANGIYEPLWNRNYIHHVEITSAESIGVESRGGYYDSSGALRDMIQNHLMQLVGLVAMEPPSTFDSNSIRNEVVKVFLALRQHKPEEISKFTIRGQYLSSKIKGRSVPGYREEKGVHPESKTETYAAMKFFIDNWRWGGVPFYIRSGKRLPTRVTEIVIHFKRTPHYLFKGRTVSESSNQLIIRIQPDEGILMKLGMKVPGAGFNVQNVNMSFRYADLSNVYLPTAYQRLLNDAMLGDSTLYARGDAVLAAWTFVKPIQDAWANDPSVKVYGYPAGTWGPENADELFNRRGITWRYPCENLTDDGIFCEL